MVNSLMKYIPKEYKGDVKDIRTGVKEWDETTKHWTTTVIVTWTDGSQNEYANKSFMREHLKEFGK